MIAQHLQGGVFPGTLHEVQDAHVVQHHEGQSQRDEEHQLENAGHRVQHGHGVQILLIRVFPVVQLVQRVDGIQPALRGLQQKKGRRRESALPAALPLAAAHEGHQADVDGRNGRDCGGNGLVVSGQPEADDVAHAGAQILGQLLAQHHAFLRQGRPGVVRSQQKQPLVVLKHGEGGGAALFAGADADGLVHDCLHPLCLHALFIALRRTDRTRQIHPGGVGQRALVVLAYGVGHAFLQAHGGDDQHGATQYAHQRGEGTSFVAHQVAGDHLGVEAHTTPQLRKAFQQQLPARLGGLGAQQLSGGFPAGLPVGAVADGHGQQHAQPRHQPFRP